MAEIGQSIQLALDDPFRSLVQPRSFCDDADFLDLSVERLVQAVAGRAESSVIVMHGRPR